MTILEQACEHNFELLSDYEKLYAIKAIKEMDRYSWLNPFLFQYHDIHRKNAQVEGFCFLYLKEMIYKGELYLRFFEFESWAVSDKEISVFDRYENKHISIGIKQDRSYGADGYVTIKNKEKFTQVVFDDNKQKVENMDVKFLNPDFNIPFEVGTTSIVKTLHQLRTGNYLARLPYVFDDKLKPMIAVFYYDGKSKQEELEEAMMEVRNA